MKNVFIYTIIALMAINLGLYAQKKETTQEKSKIELSVVYEKTFDEPIVDVIFDTVTVSIEEAKEMGWREEVFTSKEKEKGEKSVFYHRVVIIGENEKQVRKIVFYSKNEVVKKVISVAPMKERVLVSKNGKYILKAKRYDELDAGWQGAILYDYDGDVIWQKNEGIFTAVSNEGYTATGFASPDGGFYPFAIYTPTGGKHHITIESSLLFNAGGCFSGNFYVIASGNSKSTTLFVVSTQEGKIDLEKEFPGYILNRDVNIFSDGIVVALRTNESDRIIFLDWKGEIKWEVTPPDLFLIGSVDFWRSQERGKIYVYTSAGDLFIIQNAQMKKQFKIEKNLKRLNDFFVKISENKILLISEKERQQ